MGGDFSVKTDVCRNMLTSGGSNSQGLSTKTVNGVISVLKNVMKYAENEKSISTKQIGHISLRCQPSQLRVLSSSEQTVFSRYLCCNLDPCYLGILLCLYTGLRIGEICALQWRDISINEQLLSVHQSMQRVQTGGQDGKKTRVVIQSPKSSCSIRRIPIPFEIHKLLVASQKQADAFLLTGLPDRFMEPRCLENRFKAAASACEIYNVNYHTLRHTFATRCVELGFDIKSLSEILGHTSVNITMNRYVHPSMEFKKKNMNRLSAKYTDALFYK